MPNPPVFPGGITKEGGLIATISSKSFASRLTKICRARSLTTEKYWRFVVFTTIFSKSIFLGPAEIRSSSGGDNSLSHSACSVCVRGFTLNLISENFLTAICFLTEFLIFFRGSCACSLVCYRAAPTAPIGRSTTRGSPPFGS